MGTMSLAVSLGSKDMFSDIFAGIMILFEHQFQVGDTVDLEHRSEVNRRLKT